MWDVVNTEIGKTKKFRDYTDLLTRPDGSKYLCKTEAVDDVNKHFVSAAAACGAPTADVMLASKALAKARPPADRSIKFKTFSAAEVFKILASGVAHKKSKDIYNMSTTLLYLVAAPMANTLARLYNMCINIGVYPRTLKFVKVSPLYKGKGKQEDMNNYRPVSIIPGIAKVFEHGLSNRLIEYLSQCKSLSDRQYAYREGRSTTALARELIRRVLEAREIGQQVAVILCDLSKAFDVADHDVLATKMKHYGIDGNVLSLLTDFMTGRCQVVVGEGGSVKSKALETYIGVAQGSSLSNIMFSLLLNDLPENVHNGHVLMYADDVAAIVTAPTVHQLELNLNKVAHDLNQWFKTNGLILNVNKTQFMTINLAGRRREKLNVKIDNMDLEQVQRANFLGFQLDSALTWEFHIDNLCEKVGRACFALWRVSAVIPLEMARNCYFASVHAVIQYGIELWGRGADWERVFRMQKRAIRAIKRVPQDTPAKPLFQSMGILTVPSLVILQAALYARGHLAEYPKRGDGHHNICLRHAHRLRPISRKLNKTSKLVHVMAPDVYNRLPGYIRDTVSMNCFKYKLKKWLAEKAFYNFKELFD